jgi:hypothetical protein
MRSNFRMCRSLGTWNGYFYDWEGGYEVLDSMMTFVLVPGEGEHDFKANAWSLKGRQTISGSWSKGENDVMQIKFKYQTSFSSTLWLPIFFDGGFYPERDALTGVWGWSAEPESSIGVADFRRIQPCYLTLYPSFKELLDDNLKPRMLWKFAISAVRNDIQRRHWPWSYFSRRRDDRKIVVSLSVRSRWFGPPLSDAEKETLKAIVWRLTPDDACFYDSKIDYIRVYTCVHE